MKQQEQITTNAIIFIISIFLAFLIMPSDVIGQGCGAVATQKQIDYIANAMPKARSFNGTLTRGIVDVPVQIHVIRNSNGKRGIAEYRIQEALSDLNSHFINANIRFVALDNINYIDNDYYHNFNVEDEEALGRAYDIDKVVNIYIANSISSGQVSLCGYAYFPPGNDRVMMSKSCINNGSTLPHEMGHYFMLYHTHGITNNGKTDELVDGSNCHIAGDRVCDTEADPNIAGFVNSNCEYTGRMRDSNGNPYAPDPLNMMSYSTKACRQKFSKGQFTRMNYAVLNHRNYLKFPPKKVISPTPQPIAQKDEPSLSGALTMEIADQNLPTTLDNNLFKSKEGYYGGTNYQLFISNHQTAYVYVLGGNLTNDINVLFPLDNQSALIFKGKEKFALPENDYMYQMDNLKGKDYICVLYSKRPLQIQEISQQMKRETGNFMQKLYKTLGKHVVPLNQIEYKQGAALEFSAQNARNQYIVPVVVEIKHL